LALGSCASVPDLPIGEFPVPPPPDYGKANNWAALPATDDAADLTPGDSLQNLQRTASADVFFIHPTIYRDTRRDNRLWNADLADAELNESVDESTIRNQASVFNAAGRVYAPRYRQAHLSVFYEEGKSVKQQALDTAYQDVRAAFRYFLTHYNRTRPIVIAAHSQGTLHAERLLEEFFDGKPLSERLVAAYLVGMPIGREAFATIPLCTTATQTGCFVSWRTYRDDFEPGPSQLDTSIAVVNPLTWTEGPRRAPASLNRGTVLYDFDGGPEPAMVWAEIRGGALYVNKPSFFGDIFFRTRNYHIADYNLFYVNVRDNARTRVQAWWDNRQAAETRR
jgi:hypothetical protein